MLPIPGNREVKLVKIEFTVMNKKLIQEPETVNFS